MLANQCYPEGGFGVLQARVVLVNSLNKPMFFEDNCNLNGNHAANFMSNAGNGIKDEFSLSAFPNPGAGKITFAYDKKDGGSISILNFTGQAILKTKIEEGNSSVDIDLSSLPDGLYYYIFKRNQDGESIVNKLILTK